MAAFRGIGLEPRQAPTPSVFGAVLPLVAAAAGWVPASELMAAQAMPGVISLPVQGFELATGFDVIWWRESPHSALRELVTAVREAARVLLKK